MQHLLSEIAILPTLLYQTDSLLTDPQSGRSSKVEKMLGLFLDMYDRLDNRQTSIYAENLEPYWLCGDIPRKAELIATEDNHISLCFANVTMANLFTHIWAFQIVCLAEIERLAQIIRQCGTRQPTLTKPLELDLNKNQERTTALAIQICHSMDYLLQDEMGLYGPASIFYPLRVAYQTLEANECDQTGQIVYIEQVVDRLARKGLLSARSYVLDD